MADKENQKPLRTKGRQQTLIICSLQSGMYLRYNTYIGETMRNFNVREAEHENCSHISQPARHLLSNPTHSFTWDIIHKEQSLFKIRIILGLLIAREQRELNKQVQCFIASLYTTGIS